MKRYENEEVNNIFLEMVKQEQEFEKEFQEYGFKNFEQYIGWTVPEFEQAYKEFTTYIQGFYEGCCVGHGYEYKPNEVQYPLIADVCSYGGVEFFITMGKDYRVHRAVTVNVLAGVYYIDFPPEKIKFIPCEEVMKQLMLAYYMNIDYYEEAKAEIAEYQGSPECEISAGGLDEFPF